MDQQSAKHNGLSRDLRGIDAFILCGGQGTRFRSVLPNAPKSLAPFNEKPFLDILMEILFAQGVRRIVLGVGYLKDDIKNKYQNVPNVFISEEHTPLGTGGALKNAERFITSDDFLVTNGDSVFMGLDYEAFYDFHTQHSGSVSIALAAPRAEKDFGGVSLAADNQITAFNEKNNLEEHNLMSGGVYLMKRSVFEMMPTTSFSLETDFFPRLVHQSLYGFAQSGEVIDIGTPERYERAKKIFS